MAAAARLTTSAPVHSSRQHGRMRSSVARRAVAGCRAWGHGDGSGHTGQAGSRLLLGAGLGIGAVLGLVACEGGGLNTGAVAFTTDQLGTRELERQGLDVQWLTCTASYDGDGGTRDDGKTSRSPSASANTVANVDCTGEDKEGRDISLTGKVTKRSTAGASAGT